MRTAMWVAGMAWMVASAALAVEVELTVQEPAGIARSAEPVSGGIPLPPGQFKPGTAKLALFDGDKPVPCQVTELVVGPKGDVTWVLVDCQLDLKANETRKLTLRDGEPARPSTPLKVTETAEGVTVDTGKVAFTISKTKPFGLFSEASAGGQKVLAGGKVTYTDADSGKTLTAAAPDTVKVHYAGPMRATIEVRGRFADDPNKAFYCTYITAWAGRSDVDVRHKLINSRSDTQHYIKLGGSAIQLDLPGGDKNLVTGGAGWAQLGSVRAADRLFASDPPRLLKTEGGSLVLDAAPPRSSLPENLRGFKNPAVSGENRWLFDCSHHRSEYRIALASFDGGVEGANQAKAAAARCWARAPGSWYSTCRAMAVGQFGTLDDEKACHKLWNWEAGREPSAGSNPTRFVAWEDNHYESEADSAEAMILLYLRTGQRGFLDEGEAWVRYHTDLQAWRTEGWQWTEGGVWWPKSGAFAGARKVRKAVPPPNNELWRIAMAKACYCHFYGAGLVDWFCLTGDLDALDAAIDNCQMKYNEQTHHRNLTPGKSNTGDIRGFGRGFYVAVRTWMVRPNNELLKKQVQLERDVLAQLPPDYLDERGVTASVGKGEPASYYMSAGIKKFMEEKGITIEKDGTVKDAAGKTWKWKGIGGTWEICYVQHGANLYAEATGDEDMADYAIAAGHFAAKYMLSPVAKQTWYIVGMDIPVLGEMADQWKYDGLQRNEQGEGPAHSGWYTCFFPDACARAYSFTGEKALLDKAVEFWSYGNRRQYQTKAMSPKHRFASHTPPKDDSVLSTSRLFYEAAHPRKDDQPPAAVKDLAVRLLGEGKAEVSFTAPADPDGIGSGKVVRYQVKCAELPIVPYEQWDYVRDSGSKRNWWKAANCAGEPAPAGPGGKEKFVVSGVPAGQKLHFAVRSFDDSSNRSLMSNVVEAK